MPLMFGGTGGYDIWLGGPYSGRLVFVVISFTGGGWVVRVVLIGDWVVVLLLVDWVVVLEEGIELV